MGSTGNYTRALPVAQEKTLRGIITRTKNLKNEQSRIVDKDGNIILTKQGGKREVAYTVGEKRENMQGNIAIHNHPDGGTFSSADFSDFGYGATDIIAVSPEGVYRLSAKDISGNGAHGDWVKMRDAYEAELDHDMSFTKLQKQAQQAPHLKKLNAQIEKISKQWVDGRKNGLSQDKLDNLMSQYDKLSKQYKDALQKERRRLEVEPSHNWLKKNAKKYGYTYTFTEHRTRGKK